MRCHEARQLIGPYLDSELDAKSSFEIEQHLESCRDCAQFFEAEQKLDDRISSLLRQGQKTGPLWERVESQVAAPGFRARIWPRRILMRMGLGFATIVVILLAASIWSTKRVPDLAAVVEQDHEEFLAGKFGPEFYGPLPESVSRRLDERLDPAAFAQLPSAPGFRAGGSRLCFLRGVPAAWTLGHYANGSVSVVVLKRSQLDHFPQIKQRFESGRGVVCVRTGRYQFAARLVGGHVVCAVAGVSRQMVEDLVKSVPGAG